MELLTNGSRCRGWCFTINNYGDGIVDELKTKLAGSVYYCFQREVGEQLTPHIQGYVYYKEVKSFKYMKELGLNAHLSMARGTAEQNRTYCSKPGGTDFLEEGRLPKQGPSKSASDKRDELDEAARSLVDKSCRVDDIALSNPGLFVVYNKGLTALESRLISPRNPETPVKVYWLFGPTGTGKSKWAMEHFPQAYWKMGTNHWWDGYQGEETVIIDDYRTGFSTFQYLLTVLDRYRMRVEMKGSSIQLAATTFVITTPLRPEDTWTSKTDEAIGQLLRRITHVVHFQPNSMTDSTGTPCLESVKQNSITDEFPDNCIIYKSPDVVYVPNHREAVVFGVSNYDNNRRFK